MAQLLLRGMALGEVKAVLFDKDGTLSISEPQLITLAEARVFLCLERVDPALHTELRQLLGRAYGLREAGAEQAGRSAICPAGITAVASRDHNLIATATALVQVGLGWPEALSLSEDVFAEADRADARRAGPAPKGRAICPSAGESADATAAQTESSGTQNRPQPAVDATSGQSIRNRDNQSAPAAQPSGRSTSHTTEGLKDWLEQLRSASVACAVISNDDVAGIEHFLTSHGLEPFFQAIWSAEHRPRKPDPAAVHGLCQLLEVSPGACALIGDANSDLRMAVAAGIPHPLALGYTAAWSTPPPLAEPHPRVHHWRELSLN